MAIVDLVMPKMGESIMEATILKWHKQPGETIRMDETLLEIATDKVDSEVPSTAEGVVEEVLYKENDVVPIGTVIAKIRTGAEAAAGSQPSGSTPQQQAGEAVSPSAAPHMRPQETYTQVQEVSSTLGGQSNGQKPSMNGNRFYSPLVLNIAASEGVSMSELENIPGTGNEGRVTKKDILQYVQTRGTKGKTQEAQAPRPSQQVARIQQPEPSKQEAPEARAPQPVTYSGNVEIIEMDRMRKLIAKHMVDSKHTSPHVTSFAEADVTNMVLWRDRIKKEFEKREGEKITFTPLFIEAIVKCIKKYPWLNSSVDGDKIVVKKDINIGMATALPSGNLIVPVIRNADQLNLVGLTRQVNGLANAARNNKLKPDDTSNGTFTLTNVGSFGSIMGTPIINQPQVAILAVGAIKKRPVVIETEQGDSIAIRHMMYLSMSYDHRIIDGALGATFLTAVAKELENFNANREI
ncbi:MAG TPA: dihydrolipoamide acetyltransferase family protein [Chitinophagaceae bacterium]|nr:dihydrolipoamide acetyltransferase family protein [Chitinophagaceae bacterium]